MPKLGLGFVAKNEDKAVDGDEAFDLVPDSKRQKLFSGAEAPEPSSGQPLADTAKKAIDIEEIDQPLVDTAEKPINIEEIEDTDDEIERIEKKQAADETGGSTQSFEEWTMSFQQGRALANGRRELLPGASEEEVAEFCKREEMRKSMELAQAKERKKMQLTDAVESIDDEFLPIVENAEARVVKVEEGVLALEGLDDPSPQDVLRCIDELDQLRDSALHAVTRCNAYIAGAGYLALVRGGTEAAKLRAVELTRRSSVAISRLKEPLEAISVAKRMAEERRDLNAKKKIALKLAADQDRVFNQYDRDGDGFLNAEEVEAFVKEDCNFALSLDKISEILKTDPFQGLVGVPREHFARLRLLVGVAAVTSALSGVEVEVVKVEAMARPLTAQGPTAIRGKRLADATEELERAADAANDYVAAAREQVQGITETGEHADGPEATALSARLTDLETRLVKAAAVVKRCKDKQELNRRKAAALRGF